MEVTHDHGDPNINLQEKRRSRILTQTIMLSSWSQFRVMIVVGARLTYSNSFQKMCLNVIDLIPMSSTLIRFLDNSISSRDMVNPHVTFGLGSCLNMIKTIFLVASKSLTYNAIIERPTLNRLQVVVSTYHISMVFTRLEIEQQKSDPKEYRRCYLNKTC